MVSIESSSETQGQIVGSRESLDGRKNKARRKVKKGEKSPWVSEDGIEFETCEDQRFMGTLPLIFLQNIN